MFEPINSGPAGARPKHSTRDKLLIELSQMAGGSDARASFGQLESKSGFASFAKRAQAEGFNPAELVNARNQNIETYHSNPVQRHAKQAAAAIGLAVGGFMLAPAMAGGASAGSSGGAASSAASSTAGGAAAGGSSMPAWLQGLQAGASVLGSGGGDQVSSGESTSRTSQDVFMRDTFARLFGGAESAVSRIDPADLTATANQLFTSGTSFLGELEAQAGGAGSTVDDEIAQLESDLGRFFEREIDPALTTRGVQTGTLGGSREGVARGVAAGELGREFIRGSTDIRSRERDRRLGAAQAGISALPTVAALGEAEAMAPLAPFASLSQILGAPTPLTQSASESSQRSEPADGGLFGFL